MELKENNKIDEINDEIISPSQQDAENDKTISLSQQSADIKHLSMSIDALIKTNSDNIKNQDQAFYLENSDYFWTTNNEISRLFIDINVLLKQKHDLINKKIEEIISFLKNAFI